MENKFNIGDAVILKWGNKPAIIIGYNENNQYLLDTYNTMYVNEYDLEYYNHPIKNSSFLADFNNPLCDCHDIRFYCLVKYIPTILTDLSFILFDFINNFKIENIHTLTLNEDGNKVEKHYSFYNYYSNIYRDRTVYVSISPHNKEMTIKYIDIFELEKLYAFHDISEFIEYFKKLIKAYIIHLHNIKDCNDKCRNLLVLYNSYYNKFFKSYEQTREKPDNNGNGTSENQLCEKRTSFQGGNECQGFVIYGKKSRASITVGHFIH